MTLPFPQRLLAAALALLSAACQAREPSPDTSTAATEPGADWVRVVEDDRGRPLAMQTAVVRYEGDYAPAGRRVAVDLVGAIHIGDATYYSTLNRRFRGYDVLLYELVAPEGTVVQPGERASARNPLGAMQSNAKTMLELEHQLERIDYTAANFVHADMSPEQFFASMKDREGGVVPMMLKMVGQQIAAQSGNAAASGAEFEMLFALFSSDRARRLKIAMAKQLAASEELFSSFGGEAGSTLITERNKVAMAVLRRELLVGRRRVGVFYGAGHLADMHERLVEEFGLRPTGIEWLTAWDLAAGNRE